jgi:excisionase family DNA binding protein
MKTPPRYCHSLPFKMMLAGQVTAKKYVQLQTQHESNIALLPFETPVEQERASQLIARLNLKNDPLPQGFITLDDAALEIGCSRRFLENRITDGELAVFRPSARLVRIRRTEFERWLNAFTTSNHTRTGATSTGAKPPWT